MQNQKGIILKGNISTLNANGAGVVTLDLSMKTLVRNAMTLFSAWADLLIYFVKVKKIR
ncbi:hypothetical protein HMPREF1562_1361 [Providencia alcalifaciens F90-2004]|nr:hypothetical protein HMPREF1562_1361 [Providencia alcalifaciens F90-2004]